MWKSTSWSELDALSLSLGVLKVSWILFFVALSDDDFERFSISAVVKVLVMVMEL